MDVSAWLLPVGVDDLTRLEDLPGTADELVSAFQALILSKDRNGEGAQTAEHERMPHDSPPAGFVRRSAPRGAEASRSRQGQQEGRYALPMTAPRKLPLRELLLQPRQELQCLERSRLI